MKHTAILAAVMLLTLFGVNVYNDITANAAVGSIQQASVEELKPRVCDVLAKNIEHYYFKTIEYPDSVLNYALRLESSINIYHAVRDNSPGFPCQKSVHQILKDAKEE